MEIVYIILSLLAIIFSITLFIFGKKKKDDNLILAGIGIFIIAIILISQIGDIVVFLY